MSYCYIPKSKTELIKYIRPMWNGLVSDLRTMPIKQLYAIFFNLRRKYDS